jgi:hypothetical protein
MHPRVQVAISKQTAVGNGGRSAPIVAPCRLLIPMMRVKRRDEHGRTHVARRRHEDRPAHAARRRRVYGVAIARPPRRYHARSNDDPRRRVESWRFDESAAESNAETAAETAMSVRWPAVGAAMPVRRPAVGAAAVTVPASIRAALRHHLPRQPKNRPNAKDHHDCLVRGSHFESPSFLQVVVSSFRRLHVVAAVTEQDSDEPPRLAEVGENSCRRVIRGSRVRLSFGLIVANQIV